jgi:hypothetical protein
MSGSLRAKGVMFDSKSCFAKEQAEIFLVNPGVTYSR